MHPILFSFDTPEFLRGFLPNVITIYSYGSLIALGAISGYWFTAWRARKELGIKSDEIIDLMIIIIVAAVVGGRFFVFFENPSYYFGDPSNMLKFSSRGFVFYGSLIFAVPAMLWYLNRKKIPTFPMLDIMAFTAIIVHSFGRMGCFFAGCCYGEPTDGFVGVSFTHPRSAANPLHTDLHPTQLYSFFMLWTIFIALLIIKRRREFYGQLFLTYVAFYAVGRSIIEVFRGDLKRGFIIDDLLSHSQFISLVLLGVVYYFYTKWQRDPSKKVKI